MQNLEVNYEFEGYLKAFEQATRSLLMLNSSKAMAIRNTFMFSSQLNTRLTGQAIELQNIGENEINKVASNNLTLFNLSNPIYFH